MIVWRVTHRRHAGSPWSGDGARLHGGRWNSRGRAAVYASDHAALAVLEVLVRMTPADLHMFRLFAAEIDENAVAALPRERLEDGWDAFPVRPQTQSLGDAWLDAGEALALRVPSTLVPVDNILLNPDHDAFPRLEQVDGPLPIPLSTRLAG